MEIEYQDRWERPRLPAPLVGASIVVARYESIESALRRFKKVMQKTGVLAEARKHERYEKPSSRKRRKAAAARRRRGDGVVL